MSDRLFASEGDSVDTGRLGPTRRPAYGGAGQHYPPHPHASQPHASQPYEGRPYENQPYENQPYGSRTHEDHPNESPSRAPQPYGSQPYESQSYESRPYESQPYDAQSYDSQPFASPAVDPPVYPSEPFTDQPQAGPPEDAALGVARRLQNRLERHLELLEQLPSEYAQRRELNETARRIRRDTESIALLSGEDPVGHGNPRRLAEVLDDAASAADETWRVLVRPASAATLAPAASVELMHVLAEVIDHVTAAYPDAGVGVASYLGARTGVSVEVSVNGAGRYTPDGLGARRAAGAAEAHASRSRAGITVNHPAAGPPQSGSGLVASVSCPAASVTIDEPAWSASAAGPTSAPHPPNGNGRGAYRSNGSGRTAAPTLRQPTTTAPDYSPSVSSQVDELFGPLVDLPPEPVGDNLGTPIFEAIASAWFREDAAAPDPLDDSGPRDWESPSDSEWRAAAARAAQPEPPPDTSSGLPRRKPGNQLVPPPRSRPAPEEPAERVPDRVRSRLSTYQRGLHQGRHRAPAPETERW